MKKIDKKTLIKTNGGFTASFGNYYFHVESRGTSWGHW